MYIHFIIKENKSFVAFEDDDNDKNSNDFRVAILVKENLKSQESILSIINKDTDISQKVSNSHVPINSFILKDGYSLLCSRYAIKEIGREIWKILIKKRWNTSEEELFDKIPQTTISDLSSTGITLDGVLNTEITFNDISTFMPNHSYINSDKIISANFVMELDDNTKDEVSKIINDTFKSLEDGVNDNILSNAKEIIKKEIFAIKYKFDLKK